LDFIGNFNDNSSNGYSWVIIATNYFTKWVEIIPTGFFLEELGATLLIKPLPFGNKKSVGGIME